MSNTPTELQCARWWSRGWGRLWWQCDVEPSDSSVLRRAQKAHTQMCAAFDAEQAAQAEQAGKDGGR